MSLARAFTTRRVRQTLEIKNNREAADNNSAHPPSDGLLHRKQSTKAFMTHGSIRNKISGPVELVHTTNMLSYSAPDIFPGSNTATANVHSSPSTSSKSDDESDSGYTAASTPPTSPDTPSPNDKRAMSPEPNHLSCYFTPPRQTTPEASGLGIASADSSSSSNSPNASPAQAGTAAFPASEAPAIPQRAPSHTKKSYDGLTRHRSVSRMSEQSSRSLSTKASFSFSRSSSSSTSTSVTSTSHTATVKPSLSVHHHAPAASVSGATGPVSSVAPPPVSHKKDYSETHPFGHELAKVSELVEEFGKDGALIEEPAPISSNPIFAEEERELVRQGLKKYSAESYISDIQGLMTTFFSESRPMAAVWI
ncbi:hypothetical protein HMPREF1624_07573 [Sporothrix schenckii ATCC 58251]|uniref:Uncharacterized protein n=1 Tax=Sporothrix schenckii (strain ATCC 58251 / de Perez 2211183) TaxID=1391915 RepID=U7PKF0_SPOS1|nr:hypothetical protein HMPREF1624_07573 [Sporothrix schenckii ATCC 58251]